jgi:DNA-nicking Smr family endonuclease
MQRPEDALSRVLQGASWEQAVGISDDDREAFRSATEGVRKLKPRNLAKLDGQRPSPKARQARAARDAILEQSLNGPDGSAANEEIVFRRDGITNRSLQRLKRGELSIEAEIDLHGMRLAEAKTELQAFLRECVLRKLACVRVVHGKGTRSGPDGPILKPSVHHWLSRRDDVQAFVSAQARHGGSGAVYVLLRR